MPTRLAPYTNRLRRWWGGGSDLARAARRIEVVEPASTEARPPAVFLEGELAKVTAVQAETSWSQELARIRGGLVQHRALVRYELDDALVFASGFAAAGRNHARFGPLPHRALLTGRVVELDHAVSCHTSSAVRYFGHWLNDALPSALLAESGRSVLLPWHGGWPHASEYLARLDISPTPGAVFRVRELECYDDVGQGASRRARLRELRRRLRTTCSSERPAHSRVYLRRGPLGAARAIANEDELLRALEREGFCVVDAGNAELEAVVAPMLDAELAVSVEGSHQAHALLALADEASLLSIQPSDRFSNVYATRAAALRWTYGFTVAATGADGRLQVDVDSLLRTVELCERSRRRSA